MGEPLNILNIGIVGCGNIIAQYLGTLPSLETLRLVAVADLDLARAEAVAADLPGVRALSVQELMDDDEVQLVLNLTIPAAHAQIALQAIAAGKHVYGEKPLAATADEAAEVLAAAATAGVMVGCAPDTVLGTGTQTARRAIDDGLIGRPISATATMMTPGHERWHPNPDFYYVPGGGPLLDMGPYYVSSLVTLLGPVKSVIGAASHTRDSRTIGTGPRAGEEIPVSTDTHVSGVLIHESGALSTLVMSFDAVATQANNIEIHGDCGSLIVPDPNRFDGDVKLRRLDGGASGGGGSGDEWETLPVSGGYVDGSRGIGLHDLAATAAGAEPRAGGALAFHALEVMESVLTSAHAGRLVDIASTCPRPDAVPLTQPAEVRTAMAGSAQG